MQRIEKLTEEQKALMPVVRDKWIDRALSGEYDFAAIEKGVEWLYSKIIQKPTPPIITCSCPYEAISLVAEKQRWFWLRDELEKIGRKDVDEVLAAFEKGDQGTVASILKKMKSFKEWKQEAWNQRSAYFNHSDVHFCAWGDFYKQIGLDVMQNNENFDNFSAFIWGNPFMSWFYDKFCFIVKPPTKVFRNGDTLHNLDDGAVIFENGSKFYFVRGRPMPARIFEQEITFEDFINEPNEDYRAGMYDVGVRKGYISDWMVEVDSVTLTHRSGKTETLKLYRSVKKVKGTVDQISGERDGYLAWLGERCPSTGQDYFIPTSPSFKTALEAAKRSRPNQIPFDLELNWNQNN